MFLGYSSLAELHGSLVVVMTRSRYLSKFCTPAVLKRRQNFASDLPNVKFLPNLRRKLMRPTLNLKAVKKPEMSTC